MKTGRIEIVIGPPAAGKSTYVAERFRVGHDLVVDWDRLLAALTMEPPHTWIEWVCPYVEAARQGVLNELARSHVVTRRGNVFVIACNMPPEDVAKWKRRGARVTEIPTRAEVCRERIMADPERRKVAREMMHAVDRWHETRARS